MQPAAQQVRVIGGPTGPFGGAIGAIGPAAAALGVGATGPQGRAGTPGFTGPSGLVGLLTTLFGPTGVTGPTGSEGAAGMTGPHGSGAIVPDGRFQYYEYAQGIDNIPVRGFWVGCKFMYAIKHAPAVVVFMFSGLITCQNSKPISVATTFQPGSAPDAGTNEIGGAIGGSVLVSAPTTVPRTAIPFFVVTATTIYPSFEGDPPVVGQLRWLDLFVATQGTTFDSPAGSIKNINCIVMEF